MTFKPIPSDWAAFLAAVRQLGATRAGDLPVEVIAAHLEWSVERARLVAADLTEQGRIETDMGLGDLPTVVEADD